MKKIAILLSAFILTLSLLVGCKAENGKVTTSVIPTVSSNVTISPTATEKATNNATSNVTISPTDNGIITSGSPSATAKS